MADADFNITGIMDWKSSQLVSVDLVLRSPLAFSFLGLFFEGITELAKDETTSVQLLREKGSPELEPFFQKWRVQQKLFTFICG